MTPEEYDAWYDTDRGRWIGETEYHLLFKLLTPQSGEQLLDVGCGTGWFTRRFAEREGVEITGADIDEESLAFARKHDVLSSYVDADARHLPFADDSFHKVVSVTALCFIQDWPRALSEIVRVARDRFAVGLLNRHSLLYLKKGRHGGLGAYAGAHWHTRRELRQALKSLSVDDVQIRTAVLLPSASLFAKRLEQSLSNTLPFGSFLVVVGHKP